MVEPDAPTLATFQPLVGQAFLVEGPEGQVTSFELIEARDLSAQMSLPDGYRAPYSLLFQAAEEIDWAQGTYVFTHPSLEPLRLFASAVISPQGQGRHAYEVVFA